MPGRSLNLTAARGKIVRFIKNGVESAGADGAVVGISGGIDSAVTSYLTVEAIGSRRVLGAILPDMRVTSEGDFADSKAIADELGIECKVLDIAPLHRAFMKEFESNRLAEGNLRARIRMSILYYMANSSNRLVVGTGDRSESLLGFFTKLGDGGVELLPIGVLYKTEVRELGEVLGVSRKIVTKRSSPNLWPGQTAEGELGAQYELIDRILRLYVDDKIPASRIPSKLGIDVASVKRVLDRYAESRHKRMMPEVCVVH